MATETAVALDSNFKLLLMSRILVAVEKMVASCYNISPLWSPGAARQHPREFDTNNTHTIMFDPLNTLRLGQNGRHFPDDIFKCIFLNENVPISITISPKFVPKRLINNIPALVQIMAWRRLGDNPLSAPLMVILPTHMYVTRPQWVLKDKLHWLYFHQSLNNIYGTSRFCLCIPRWEHIPF